MRLTIPHILYIFVFVIVSCCKHRSSLPKALSAEEIRAYFPKSEPTEIGPYEISMRKHGLVDIQSLEEDIFVNLKYSSDDNFFGFDVYKTLELAYLQPKVAEALVQANKDLKRDNPNLRLLVYDAARPLSVQKVLWNALDSLPVEERKKYVAEPAEVSLHNYGCAVDLTIFDRETGKPLDMGTPFDFFGELAYPKLERRMLNEGKLSLKQLNNRILLRSVMESAGFMPISTEWWHFNYYSRKEASSRFRPID